MGASGHTVPREVPLSPLLPSASAPQHFLSNGRGVLVTFLLLSSLHGEADCEDTQYTFTNRLCGKKMFQQRLSSIEVSSVAALLLFCWWRPQRMSPSIPKARASPGWQQLLAQGTLSSRVCSRCHHHRVDVTVPFPCAQSRRLPRGIRMSLSRWSVPIRSGKSRGDSAPAYPGSGLSVEGLSLCLQCLSPSQEVTINRRV